MSETPLKFIIEVSNNLREQQFNVLYKSNNNTIIKDDEEGRKCWKELDGYQLHSVR